VTGKIKNIKVENTGANNTAVPMSKSVPRPKGPDSS
jgi:ankyrin repeat protein